MDYLVVLVVGMVMGWYLPKLMAEKAEKPRTVKEPKKAGTVRRPKSED